MLFKIIWIAGGVLGIFLNLGYAKFTLDIEPRTPTFAYPVEWVVKNIPLDAKVICWGYERTELKGFADVNPATFGACVDLKPDQRHVTFAYPNHPKKARLEPGSYDAWIQTYDVNSHEVDYRVRKFEVK